MNTKHLVILICLLLGMARAEDFIKKIFGSNPFTKSITYHFGKSKTTATDDSEATSKTKRGVRFTFGKSKTTRKPVTITATEESEPTDESEPTTTEESTESTE